MSEKLTHRTKSKNHGTQLTRAQDLKFRMCICGKLDNNFEFKDLNPSSVKEFHRFINDTVGRDLLIREVDQLYLRNKGPITEVLTRHGEIRDIVHYGKSNDSFRIFGYYNDDGYFTITRIDPSHKTHS